jgi:hypothetical protein
MSAYSLAPEVAEGIRKKDAGRVADLVRKGNLSGRYLPTGRKGMPADPKVPPNTVILDWTPFWN